MDQDQPLFDKFSLLNGAVGVLVYYAKISFLLATLAHAAISLLYSSEGGYSFIKKYASWWPGNKRPDSFYNVLGDNISFMSGWLLASGVDSATSSGDNANQWYEPYKGTHN